MTRRWITCATVLLAILAGGVVRAQQGTVKVTAARANIRQTPSETGTVLMQEVRDRMLEFQAEEGDWFKVRIHVGAIRLDAYISKKVSTFVPADTPTPDALPAAAPPPATDGHGMRASQQSGNETTTMPMEIARVRTLTERADTVRGLAGMLPIDDAPVPAKGASDVTYVWTIAGRSASVVAAERRPTFVLTFKGSPEFAAADLVPAIVRLAPTLSGVRIVAASRGRADAATRAEADWDLMRDLRQEPVRADIRTPEIGSAIVRPTADLEPGEYGLVLRPNGKARVSGAKVLSTEGTGVVFAAVWPFSVR